MTVSNTTGLGAETAPAEPSVKNILVTGAVGFIGFHLCGRLSAAGWNVVGLDVINDYYDVRLKYDRLAILEKLAGFSFYKIDLADGPDLETVFSNHPFTVVVNLAACAGVRHSLETPMDYVNSNIVGFANLLEQCRRQGIGHLLYASSSSVYGLNTNMPFSVHHNVDHPVSLYAASKKSNELLAHSYSHLFGLPATGLRFFSVYGPWGRPDMALFKFTQKIMAGTPIDIYNHGRMRRDFTYIDDIIEGVFRLLDRPPAPNEQWDGAQPDPASSPAPHRLYNIGTGRPIPLMDFIRAIEKALGREAKKNFLPMQPGDIPASHADVDDLAERINFRPQTTVEEGIARFVEWYLDYYRVQ